MATSFSDVKLKVLRLLGDTIATVEDDDPSNPSPVGGTIYDSAILQDAVHAALKRISSRIWKTAIYEIEEAGTNFSLPLDLLDIEGVFENETGMFIPRCNFQTGQVMSTSFLNANAWINYPNGITFVNELGTDGAKIYYLAHWELPEDDEEALECPEMTVTAVTLFAASYCLLKSAVEQGDIAQYKTRVDSGQPTDIPAKELSNFLLARFENELNSLPMQTRN
jgi:hypothetical protein